MKRKCDKGQAGKAEADSVQSTASSAHSNREPQSHTVTEPSVDAARTSPGLQEILEGT